MATSLGDLTHALDLLTLPPGAPTVQELDPDTHQAVAQARPWTSGIAVVGTGAAPKVTRGQVLDQPALKIYVTAKLPQSAVPPGQLVPETVQLPGFDDPIVTDVEAIGTQRLEVYSEEVRPVMPGYSIGLLGGETGTFGCLVCKVSDPATPMVLSNSHVIAQYGLAAAGSHVIQPGPADGGSDTNEIAALDSAVYFDFDPGFNNLCDAAIATATNIQALNPSIPGIGTPSHVSPNALSPGDSVQKTGRTTGYTTGIVKDVNYRTIMSYPMLGGGWGSVGFRDQVLCSRYSDGGDSGSLVCDMNGQAVGLHWAGSNSCSIFSPIAFVFSALNIALWTPS